LQKLKQAIFDFSLHLSPVTAAQREERKREREREREREKEKA